MTSINFEAEDTREPKRYSVYFIRHKATNELRYIGYTSDVVRRQHNHNNNNYPKEFYRTSIMMTSENKNEIKDLEARLICELGGCLDNINHNPCNKEGKQ